jgi:hypothetical protein
MPNDRDESKHSSDTGAPLGEPNDPIVGSISPKNGASCRQSIF